ncbi:ABC transporter ATP-binding protein [Extibacter muris]|uniref:ABC transporter ATP-binding protein n=2 Tax=Extibacter muris TaxID=1796622 RepID=A0A4R4FEZ5_9FIRM|nr:ABC transporter ATP-binding protein [Extibacter muris]
MIPIFLFVAGRCRRFMRNASIQVKRTTASINPEFESCLSGIKTAKAFANEAAELNKFNAANHKYGIFMCILSAAVIAVGGALVMREELNLIDLITFSLYVTTFITPIRRLSVIL